MDPNTTPVVEINLQPSRAQGYRAYVPVRLGKLAFNAFVDSGNTFANVISPQTMTALGIRSWNPSHNSPSAWPPPGRR